MLSCTVSCYSRFLPTLHAALQQKQAEQEEEFIVNKLMKRLDQLKREKQVLANEV